MSSPINQFSLQDGLIKYKGRIWIGKNPQLQVKIFSALHSIPVGGHSGSEVTYKKIKQLFAWPKLKQSVQQLVEQCTICQQAKSERVAYPGLLAPLPIPDGAWQMITLYFIEGLPKSSSYNYILVVVDKYFKYAHC